MTNDWHIAWHEIAKIEFRAKARAPVARKVTRLPVAHGMSVRTALVYDGNLAPVVR